MRRLISIIVACGCLMAIGTTTAQADPHLQLIGQAGDITEPTSLVSDPSDPNRLYVTERSGRIDVVQNGQMSLLVDLSSLIAPPAPAPEYGEEALNSMVLAPDFAQTGHFYVDYPSATDGPENIQVDEMTASGGPAAVLASRRTVMVIPRAETFHHFGGDLQFGPDGYLYISVGDGWHLSSDSTYPASSPSQDLTSLLGKILRIDPNDPDGAGSATYSVPSDNPFVGTPSDRPEIWSYGLRNPFRFSIDSSTGNMFIGDVGQDAWEEIDSAPSPGNRAVGGAGLDYGWPCKEGFVDYSPAPGPPGCPASPPPFTDPIFTYAHPDPNFPDCADVIGGFLMRDPTLGDLNGRYIYGDNCSGDIHSLDPASPASSNRLESTLTDGLGATPEARAFQVESLGQDACGRTYVLAANVYRIESDSPSSCGQLRVTVSGNGSVSGPGISCPGNCTRLFTANDPLAAASLAATASPDSHFIGWQGDCSGSGACTPQVDQDRSVTAVFAPNLTTVPTHHKKCKKGFRKKKVHGKTRCVKIKKHHHHRHHHRQH